MKRKWKRWTVYLAVLAALAVSGIVASAATDTITVSVTGEYGQTEAREMLQLINEFRTGDDAWYWDESNTEKIMCAGLQPLVYDYELEKIAMLRAMEIAVYYDHVRPKGDGSRGRDLVMELVKPLATTYYIAGENIAAGSGSYIKEEVFKDWQETDKKYEDQGHRRNMLNPEFTAIGIGHVKYNGCEYWVQSFGFPTVSTDEVPANDSKTTTQVEISPSLITKKSVTPSEEQITIPFGDSVAIPEIEAKITMTETWPGDLCPVSVECQWQPGENADSFIQIDESAKEIKGIGCGTTSITATVLDTPVEIEITVEPKSLKDAVIEPQQASYDGKSKTPAFTVTAGGGGSRTRH